MIMKNINVTFTEEEHALLVKVKGKLNWHDFILKAANNKAGSD